LANPGGRLANPDGRLANGWGGWAANPLPPPAIRAAPATSARHRAAGLALATKDAVDRLVSDLAQAVRGQRGHPDPDGPAEAAIDEVSTWLALTSASGRPSAGN